MINTSKKNCIIYTLNDPDTQIPMYVGVTGKCLKDRLGNHIKGKETSLKSNWIKSLIMCGKLPSIEEVDIVDTTEWEFWERHYISLFRSWGFQLVNTAKGGKEPWNKGVNAPYSDSVLKKMGESQKERMKRIPHPMLGKKQKPEVVEKIASKKRGIRLTDEHKRKIGQAHRERGHFGMAVCQYSKDGVFIREWISGCEAGRSLKLQANHINGCCNKRYGRKTIGGYIWKFKEEVING